MRTAAIVTIGTELVEGLRIDTNTAEIARRLAPRGFRVLETVSVGDDTAVLASELTRLVSCRDLVITTGGLGPTHDDITRDAAALALGEKLVVDPRLVELLKPVQQRHSDASAIEAILSQALVLPGAEVIDFTTGTAPGLVVACAHGSTLALLPGPPAEMRPMLAALLERYDTVLAEPRHLGVVGMTESDAQALVGRAIARFTGVGFTVLAKPGDVRVILTDAGAGEAGLADAATAAAESLGERCYATDESTLAQVLVRQAAQRGLTIGLAESCTGGMVSAAIIGVPGSSQILLGGIVSYSNEAKIRLLGVDPAVIGRHGAVSAECVEAMAEGARAAFDDPAIVLSVSGVAGPDGGTADKPVGTVWFGLSSASGLRLASTPGERAARARLRRDFPPTSREAVRARATSTALDLLRRAVLELPIPE